jgi:hypothetical protein
MPIGGGSAEWIQLDSTLPTIRIKKKCVQDSTNTENKQKTSMLRLRFELVIPELDQSKVLRELTLSIPEFHWN